MKRLITVFYQTLDGFIIGILGSSIPAISESLMAYFFIGIGAGALTILIPLSLKMKYECWNSEGMTKFLFLIFTISIGISLAYLSLFINGFFLALWLLVACGILLSAIYFDATGIDELKSVIKVQASGIIIMGICVEIACIGMWRFIWVIFLPIVVFVSVFLLYAILDSADRVETRNNVFKENLEIWQGFPKSCLLALPKFLTCIKERIKRKKSN